MCGSMFAIVLDHSPPRTRRQSLLLTSELAVWTCLASELALGSLGSASLQLGSQADTIFSHTITWLLREFRGPRLWSSHLA